MIANGQIDIVIEEGLSLYDFMALIPVVKNAGGVITDWEGGELSQHSTGKIIASSNKIIHARALDLISN